jgi:hypothetical protein
VPTPEPLDAEPLRRWDAEQVIGQLGRVLEVVAAQPSDTVGVAVIFDPRLRVKCSVVTKATPAGRGSVPARSAWLLRSLFAMVWPTLTSW